MAEIILPIVMLLVAGTHWFTAVRAWRDSALTGSDMPMIRMSRLSEAGQDKLGRAILVLAVMYSCLFAFLVVAVLWNGLNIIDKETFRLLGAVCLGGFMLCVPLAVVVAVFGRPGFLVPPPQR